MGLLSFLFGGSKPAPQPAPQQPAGGLLSVPSGVTQKAYQDYCIDAQSNGQQPMAFADWAKQQQAKPPAK